MDEDNSLLSMTPSQDSIPPPDPIRVDWPKVIKSIYFKIVIILLIKTTKVCIYFMGNNYFKGFLCSGSCAD